MKKIIIPALILGLVFSCVSAPVANKIIGVADYSKIRDILWIGYAEYITPDGKKSVAAEELQKMLKEKNLNKAYQAELYAAQGILFFFKSDITEAKKLHIKAGGLSRGGQLYSLLGALISENKISAYSSLYNDSILMGDPFCAMLAAQIFENAGKWKAAVGVYEKFLSSVPYPLKDHFEEKARRAEQLKGLDGFASSFSMLAGKPQISWEEVLAAVKETIPGTLPPAVKTAKSVKEIFDSIYEKKYFLDKNAELADVCSRQDIAFLFCHLLSDYKKDPSLLDKFTKRYGNGGKSPVPDVPSVFASFDSCLLMVEWEIMELPDGKNFFPDKKIRGEEFLVSLKAFKELL